VEYSEDMNNQPVNVDVTVNITATTSPIGTSNGNKVSETATTNPHLIRTNKATPNGYDIVSIYAKAAERTFIQIQSWADPTSYVNFNLTTGVVSAYSVATIYGIESVGNGWYRCYANVQGSGAGIVGVGIITSGTAGWAQSYLGDTSKGVYMWGLQINIGSTAKPYFPTTDRLNVPRLTYQNGGGGCPSLLLEKQSTNLMYPSEDFSSGNYIKAECSVTTNQTISPDGTQNADAYISTTNNVPHPLIYLSTQSGTITYSLFVKKSYSRYVSLKNTGGPTNWGAAIYDLDSIVVTKTDSQGHTIVGTSIVDMGNGWRRITLTTTGNCTDFSVQYTPNGTATFSSYGDIIATGTNQVDYYIYGAQLEASSYATSYIPTTSASATRVADACSKTGISSLIGQTSGSVFFDFTVDTISAQTNDPVLWYMKDVGAGERYMELYSNGNLVYAEYTTSSIVSIVKSGLTVGRHKCAIAYATDDFVFYVDGVQVGTDTSGTPNGYNTFGLQYYTSNYHGQQKVNQCAIFKTRLSNSELASLTSL